MIQIYVKTSINRCLILLIKTPAISSERNDLECFISLTFSNDVLIYRIWWRKWRSGILVRLSSSQSDSTLKICRFFCIFFSPPTSKSLKANYFLLTKNDKRPTTLRPFEFPRPHVMYLPSTFIYKYMLIYTIELFAVLWSPTFLLFS